jgi:N-acetylglutamate synthase-like GNAT family acetyltransferase
MRVARQEDAPALVRLINAAFEVERPIFGGDRIDRDGVLSYLRTGKFLIAEDAHGLVGCVYGELRGESGYVGLLSVHPARQRTGLGRKLMEAVEDFFREQGCKEVELRVVSARTGLPAFYRHLGYLQTGTEALPGEIQPQVPCHFQYMTKTILLDQPSGFSSDT